MSINKWLCERFDDEKKGYVTIGDIALTSVIVFTGTVLIVSAPYAIYKFYLYGFNNPELAPFFSWETLGAFEASILLLALAGVVLYVISAISTYLWHIKIAKCPTKRER